MEPGWDLRDDGERFQVDHRDAARGDDAARIHDGVRARGSSRLVAGSRPSAAPVGDEEPVRPPGDGDVEGGDADPRGRRHGVSLEGDPHDLVLLVQRRIEGPPVGRECDPAGYRLARQREEGLVAVVHRAHADPHSSGGCHPGPVGGEGEPHQRRPPRGKLQVLHEHAGRGAQGDDGRLPRPEEQDREQVAFRADREVDGPAGEPEPLAGRVEQLVRLDHGPRSDLRTDPERGRFDEDPLQFAVNRLGGHDRPLRHAALRPERETEQGENHPTEPSRERHAQLDSPPRCFSIPRARIWPTDARYRATRPGERGRSPRGAALPTQGSLSRGCPPSKAPLPGGSAVPPAVAAKHRKPQEATFISFASKAESAGRSSTPGSRPRDPRFRHRSPRPASPFHHPRSVPRCAMETGGPAVISNARPGATPRPHDSSTGRSRPKSP